MFATWPCGEGRYVFNVASERFRKIRSPARRENVVLRVSGYVMIIAASDNGQN